MINNKQAQTHTSPTGLKLDWTLETAVDRTAFLETYLASRTIPLSESDLEMCGNYILWGRGSNGLNYEQEGYVQLERRNSTWTNTASTRQISSIEELTENPMFDEAEFHPLSGTAYRIPKPNFSRDECLAKAPIELHSMLYDLFQRIDRLELAIGFYDRAHGKRKKELPERLLRKFAPEDLFDIEERALEWTNGQYLKKKHLLVELRREQYTIRDTFANTIFPRPTNKFAEEQEPSFCGPESEDGFKVLPLGLFDEIKQTRRPSEKFVDWFLDFEALAQKKDDPYYQAQARILVERLEGPQDWAKSFRAKKSIKQADAEKSSQTEMPLAIDFRDPSHICKLLDAQTLLTNDPSLSQAQDTLNFYVRQALLNPVQRAVLELKRENKQNMDIRSIVNKQFGRSYSTNYISTIYRQYVAPAIADAASRHWEIVRAIAFGPENFKRCTCCGRLLVESESNFIHKSRSKTGFSTRCKQCDHDYRQRRKK